MSTSDQRKAQWLKSRVEEIAEQLRSNLGDNLLSIVVYGSARRPQDFTATSDINVVAITRSRLDSRKKLSLQLAVRRDVNLMLIAAEDLEKLVAEGSLLALHILKDGLVVYGEPIASAELEATLNWGAVQEKLLKRSLSRLSMALERFFEGDFDAAVAHMHQALRSALQWRCLQQCLGIQFSDVELKLHAPPKAAEALEYLRTLRDRGITEYTCRMAMSGLFSALEQVLEKKLPEWARVWEEVKRRGLKLSRAEDYVDDGRVRLRLSILAPDGTISVLEM